MVIQHNIMAMNSYRAFGVTTNKNTKSTEKLSSGYRINRAADDAAGLAISEKMRRQIRGLTRACVNAQDGVSMMQIADGTLSEAQDMLQRMNELAVQSANGTLEQKDHEHLEEEFGQLRKELDSLSYRSTFNEIPLFPVNGYEPIEASVVSSSSVVNEEEYNIIISSDGTYKTSKISPMTAVGVSETTASEGWKELADYIANDLIPDSVSKILSAFPAFGRNGGADNINVQLKVEYIDGGSNTLAYASYSYWNDGNNMNAIDSSFLVKVDSSDFNDATLNSDAKDVLKSTIAHELTHTIMQKTMTKGMTKEFPNWFKEGTAQLSGGGFVTGWNEYLQAHMSNWGVTDPSDNSHDEDLKRLLLSTGRTVEANVYGHGYLAAAYLGYLANGGTGVVTATSIASGMNKIFNSILDGKSLDEAIKENTSLSGINELTNSINNADNNAVAFIRQLVVNTQNGIGSVISPSGLSEPGHSYAGGSARENANYVPSDNAKSGDRTISLQIGSESDDSMDVKLFRMDAMALGVKFTNVYTQDSAKEAIDDVKEALERVSNVRSYYGAIQNRLEHTINNLNNVVENTTAAESRIRDTDMASEMVKYTNNQVLMQAGTAMMAQANQSKQSILSLLG